MKKRIFIFLLLPILFIIFTDSCAPKKKKLDVSKIEKMAMEGTDDLTNSVQYKLNNVIERLGSKILDIKDLQKTSTTKIALFDIATPEGNFTKLSTLLGEKLTSKVLNDFVTVEPFKIKDFLLKNSALKLFEGVGLEKVKAELTANFAVLSVYEMDSDKIKITMKIFDLDNDQIFNTITDYLEIDEEVKNSLN